MSRSDLMARIRTLKPDFWAHHKVAKLSRDARLLFVGLLSEADDEGRLVRSPKRLAGFLYPHDDGVEAPEVDGWLWELERCRLVQSYEVEGVWFIHVPGFTKHQRVSHPSDSRLPPPPPMESLPKDSGAVRETFVPEREQGTGNREGEHEAPPAPVRETIAVARKRDDTWDAILAVCGITDVTSSARGAYNRAVKDIRDLGATPDEIGRRALRFRERWPEASLTPTALARRWGECDPARAHAVTARNVGMIERVASRMEGTE